MPAKKGRPQPGQFQKGQSGNPNGRQKGKPNKLTADVKAMIEAALEEAGKTAQANDPRLKGLAPGAAYLAKQAHANPVAFMGLVGRIIPQKVDMDVHVMSEQLVTLLHSRRDQLAKMRNVTPISAPPEQLEDE